MQPATVLWIDLHQPDVLQAMLPVLFMHRMIPMNAHCDSAQPSRPLLRSVAGIVCVIFLTIGAALLMSDPRTHVIGALAFLPLLLCPLMHLFMKHPQPFEKE